MFNITNYFEHPNRPGYYVFRFYQKDKANYFEELLIKENIWFESSLEKEEGKITYLFGVKLSDYKKALHANYLVSAKFRNRTISNNYIRIIIYIVTIGIIALAIIGALKSKS